jgi:mono/diheme cytochrome c family protein
MKILARLLGGLILGLIVVLASLSRAEGAPLIQSAQDGQAIFQTKCASCHTIGGGKLVGPDLEGVTTRRDLTWLHDFILAPDKLLAAKDPIAVQLLAEYNNVAMPNMGLKEADVQAVLAYLENPDGAGAAPQPAAPLPGGSAPAGQKLFNGETPLANGGTACIACHTVGRNGAYGGGSLGPDLTYVVSRLGEPGLSSALANIVYPTMQGPFLNRPLTPQEQSDLVAYLKWADTGTPLPNWRQQERFFATGLAGALVLFAGMIVFWPKQRESLSARLRKSGRRMNGRRN